MTGTGRWFLSVLASVVSSCASALTLCPSAHLEPTLAYGRAFGSPEKITVAFDTGSRGNSEELEFQYFEYQSRDPGFVQRVFAVHVLHDLGTKKGRVILARLKDGKPVLAEMPLDEKTIKLAVATASPAVLATRFRDPPCTVVHTDGHVIQVGVAANVMGLVGGEAYAPIPGTPAGQLEVLGRALRAVALGELPESKLEATLNGDRALTP